jgi:hypothetical protein
LVTNPKGMKLLAAAICGHSWPADGPGFSGVVAEIGPHLANVGSAASHLRQCVGDRSAQLSNVRIVLVFASRSPLTLRAVSASFNRAISN